MQMDAHKISIKFYATPDSQVSEREFVPVFHSWIQLHAVSDHLLIDVSDYAHVHNGPGILLVAHEGNVGLDVSDGRPGLLYYRKTPSALSDVEHMGAIFRAAIQACRLLEKARIQFNFNEFIVITNDRLHAPNDENTFAELQPIVSAALRQAFEGAEFDLTRTSTDPKERLTMTCRRKT